MENKKTLGIAAFAMIALLGVGFAAAYQGDYSVKGPDYSEDRHEAMEDAFDNLDYNAWVALMTESGRNTNVVNVVTPENFAVFAEAHEAMENGDMELAQILRAELGLGQGKMSGNGEGQGSQREAGSHKGSGMGGQGNNGACPYAA